MLYTEILARRRTELPPGVTAETVVLTWDDRQKRRLRTLTLQGREVGIRLPAGGLQDGDLLGPGKNPALLVRAAAEPVLTILPRSPREMGHLAHQIGNRHMQAWITDEEIVVLDDPVLARELAETGVPHRREQRPLVGEPVAPPSGGHQHGWLF